MKVRVTIEVDMETGEYDLQYGRLSGPERIDAQELVEALEKVVTSWKLKFVD